MSKVRHCFLLCFYRVKSIPYGEFYHHKHEKNFQNVVAFPGLCNLLHKLEIALQLKVSRDTTTI